MTQKGTAPASGAIKSQTNKNDVEIVKLHVGAEKFTKTCKYILVLLLGGMMCYTITQLMALPADKLKALAEIAGGNNKLLLGSLAGNGLLSVAWTVTFNDNRKLRRDRA